MSQLDKYHDCLEYLPSEEKAAFKEMEFVEDEVENVALSVIKQINRSKETLKRVG